MRLFEVVKRQYLEPSNSSEGGDKHFCTPFRLPFGAGCLFGCAVIRFVTSRFGTLKQSTAEEANIHGLSFTRVSHARDFPIFAFIKFGYAYDYLAVITSQDATMR